MWLSGCVCGIVVYVVKLLVWLKVAKSGEVAKSGKKWLKVVNSGKKWRKVVLVKSEESEESGEK